jgi:hypothetical protein
LYVGYPYVEGRFQDGTFVKAPLLLFPVKLIKEKDTWLIDNIEDQYILINKVFLMAFEKYNNTSIQQDLITEVAVSRARSIYDKLKELGYEVDLGVGVSGYRLDLAIYDSKAGRF